MVQHVEIFLGHQNCGRKPCRTNLIGEVPAEVEKHRRVVGMKFGGRRNLGLSVAQRNLQIHASAWCKHSIDLAECLGSVGNMFKNVWRQQNID